MQSERKAVQPGLNFEKSVGLFNRAAIVADVPVTALAFQAIVVARTVQKSILGAIGKFGLGNDQY